MWKTDSRSCKLNDRSIEYHDQSCSLGYENSFNETIYDYIGTGVIYEIDSIILQNFEYAGVNKQRQYKFYKLKQSYNK